jgi:hypothetical protein
MLDLMWRARFACLAPLNLIFEARLYHLQLLEFADLVRAFPQMTSLPELAHSGSDHMPWSSRPFTHSFSTLP